ncbi:hypothetical protein GCM10009765_45750 [Fodinicola feengrottensis]|uniref:Uncharacterized protein n=2 Tax=Fodinicola feengrottensis TaxID=435914 RepID=A0ABN2HPH5_9ACTN
MEIMVLPGATEVHALVSVTAAGPAPAEPETALLVQLVSGATVRFLRQSRPGREELVRRDGEPGYRTGGWAAAQAREFHLCVAVPAFADGQKRVVARVLLVRLGTDPATLAEGTVLAGRSEGFIAPPPPLPPRQR